MNYIKKNKLLKSIISDDAGQSRDFFIEWASNINFDLIKWNEFILLPQAYNKLNSQITDKNIVGRIKGFQKYTWYKNNLLLKRLVEVAVKFKESNIDFIILKGAALQLTIYKNYSLRPMADTDIIINPKHLKSACEILVALGFSPATKVATVSLNNDYFTASHAYAFKDTKYDKALELELDLHIHLLSRRYSSKYDLDLWIRSDLIDLDSVKIRVLKPTEQIFHILVHSFEWEFEPNLLWVIDAYRIIETGFIDWKELIKLAVFYEVVLEINSALTLLKQDFDMKIPESVLKELSKIKISNLSKIEFYFKQKKFGFIRNLVLAYVAYLRAKNDNKNFISFIKARWGVKHAYQLPYYAFKEYLKRFGLK